MWTFRGTISGTVESQPQTLPMEIKSFSLVNKTGGNVNVNVYLINEAQGVSVSIIENSAQLAAGALYEDDKTIGMLANDKIKVMSTGSVDYNFTIFNSEIPNVK